MAGRVSAGGACENAVSTEYAGCLARMVSRRPALASGCLLHLRARPQDFQARPHFTGHVRIVPYNAATNHIYCTSTMSRLSRSERASS